MRILAIKIAGVAAQTALVGRAAKKLPQYYRKYLKKVIISRRNPKLLHRKEICDNT